MNRIEYHKKIKDLARKAGNAMFILSRGDNILIGRAYDDVTMHHYWHPAGKNGKNQAVYFCWTATKDSTGHFRSWKETHTSTKIVRTQVSLFKTRRPAEALACARWNRYMGAL